MEGLKKSVSALISEVRSKPWIWGVLVLIVVLGIFG
jgi:hypothetical protein